MAISKAMKIVLKALSYGELKVETDRQIANLKKLDPIRIFVKKLDYKILNGTYEIPVRLYFPSEKTMQDGMQPASVLLFFHGGGWVKESVETYDRVCSQMAISTSRIVVSVDYRKAPEYKFPVPLEDCYAVAKALFTNKFILNVDPDNITVIGDSAGGNIAAAVCLMARDRGEFLPRRQILIYPALNSDYSETSPFASVQENGKEYLLTAERMEQYVMLYAATAEDLTNPYFAPILEKNFNGLPDTLILTAEFDPLRDEGEEYGRKLKEAGNHVTVVRIKDAFHGYFAMGIRLIHVQESFDAINDFLV